LVKVKAQTGRIPPILLGWVFCCFSGEYSAPLIYFEVQQVGTTGKINPKHEGYFN